VNTVDGMSFIQLNREIDHENIVALKEVLLEDKSIYMVFEYAEHDFLVGFSYTLPKTYGK
jgi:serine/threonine protein kinase